MESIKESVSQENNQLNTLKTKKISDSIVQNRKTLQVLQVSANDNQTLVGKDSIIAIKSEKGKNANIKKIVPKQKPVSIFEDPAEHLRRKSYDDKAVQTEKERIKRLSEAGEDIDPEVFELMVQEEVPESYWKEVAEQRRMALNDSLHENEMLHKEIEELRDENSKLTVMASKADYFADVIQGMLSDESEVKHVTDEDSKIVEESEKCECTGEEPPIDNCEKCQKACERELEVVDGKNDLDHHEKILIEYCPTNQNETEVKNSKIKSELESPRMNGQKNLETSSDQCSQGKLSIEQSHEKAADEPHTTKEGMEKIQRKKEMNDQLS